MPAPPASTPPTARTRLERGLRIVKALHDAGVPIVAGTDEGIPGPQRPPRDRAVRRSRADAAGGAAGGDDRLRAGDEDGRRARHDRARQARRPGRARTRTRSTRSATSAACAGRSATAASTTRRRCGRASGFNRSKRTGRQRSGRSDDRRAVPGGMRSSRSIAMADTTSPRHGVSRHRRQRGSDRRIPARGLRMDVRGPGDHGGHRLVRRVIAVVAADDRAEPASVFRASSPRSSASSFVCRRACSSLVGVHGVAAVHRLLGAHRRDAVVRDARLHRPDARRPRSSSPPGCSARWRSTGR